MTHSVTALGRECIFCGGLLMLGGSTLIVIARDITEMAALERHGQATALVFRAGLLPPSAIVLLRRLLRDALPADRDAA